jgi:hypothetical protein
MVQAWLGEKEKGQRDLQLLKRRNLGNHSHNMDVVKKGEGELIVLHRPKVEVDYGQYVSCRFCYGYLAKQAIWKHACPLAPKAADGSKIPRLRKAASNVMDDTSAVTSTSFAGLLNGMWQDEVGKLASKDPLIMQLGQRLCSKFGGNPEQFSYVRSKMRQVANLLLSLRKSSGEMSSFISDFIIPTKF